MVREAVKDGVFFSTLLILLLLSPISRDLSGYGYAGSAQPHWVVSLAWLMAPAIWALNAPGMLIAEIPCPVWGEGGITDPRPNESFWVLTYLVNTVIYSFVFYYWLYRRKKTKTDLLVDEILKPDWPQRGS